MSQPRPDPRISFIIPVFNGLPFTRACLDSLGQTVNLLEHEVILIDDHSTDGTREYLAALPEPPFRIVRNEVRQGYARSNNVAAAAARGEFLCLLNNDLVLTPGWLAPMLSVFDRFPNAGVVGNVQRNPRTGQYDHMGLVFAPDGTPWHFGKHFSFRPHRGSTEWRAVTAACCLIRRRLFLEVGGFDEAYINGSEDIDLCLRLWQRGYRHYVANDSVIVHHVSVSEGRLDHVNENQNRLLEKWGEIVHRSLTRHDRRRYAYNYVLRNLTHPWRYNGPRLSRALLCLTTGGCTRV